MQGTTWVISLDIGNRNIDVEVEATAEGMMVGDDLISWADIDAARKAVQPPVRAER